MEYPMSFWGVEVKAGQTVKVDPTEPLDGYIHISQVALGEAKKDKASEPVVFHVKVDGQKFVLGTLSRDDIPHLSLDLVLDKESELSHTCKNASVYFCGYRVVRDEGNDDASDFSDSEEDDVALLDQENGKVEPKANDAKAKDSKSGKPVALTGASAKQVKIVDPKKDEDDSDEDSDDSDDSDEMDTDGDSDEESDSDESEEEETPVKKVDQGKKRPNESASKTPVSGKKAKNATPEKTDAKKGVHTATPHPMKKGGKSPKSAKDQSPNSGGPSRKGGNKSSGSGLQQRKKGK